MKKMFILLFTVFFSTLSFAESGFSQLEKLFTEGTVLDFKTLKSINQGIYVGRCFNDRENFPYGAAVGFKNMSQNSGPIIVDPDLYIGFHWSRQSDFFDKIAVRPFVDKLSLFKAEKVEDSPSYEIYFQNWLVEYRQNGEYVVQKNIVSGIEDSYCYFYFFRSK